ncbi:MFS-type transporter SLC18B1-like isoform X2 [Tetranychus urticae]|nr:MFS-type transporter SLC18B1-like isoform X2 [Tetranychus urticae]
MVIGGAILASISIVCFGLLKWSPAGQGFIILAFVIRSISAIGSSALITGNYSSIPVLFNHHMAQAYGTFELGQGLGSIFGPFIGGLVFQYTDFSGPFFVMAAMELIAALIIFIVLPPGPKYDTDASSGSSFKSVLSNYWISLNLGVSIVACIFLGFNDSSLEPHIREVANLSPFQTGSIFLASGLTYAIFSQLFGWIIDKMNDPTYLSSFSLFLCAFSIGFLGPLHGLPFKAKLWTIVLSQVTLHIGLAIAFVGTFDGAMKAHGRSKHCDDPLIPRTISSIFVAFYCFGNGVGPALAGFLVENMGYQKASWPLFCLGIVTGTILWISAFTGKKHYPEWSAETKEEMAFLRRVSINKNTHVKCVTLNTIEENE